MLQPSNMATATAKAVQAMPRREKLMQRPLAETVFILSHSTATIQGWQTCRIDTHGHCLTTGADRTGAASQTTQAVVVAGQSADGRELPQPQETRAWPGTAHGVRIS